MAPIRTAAASDTDDVHTPISTRTASTPTVLGRHSTDRSGRLVLTRRTRSPRSSDTDCDDAVADAGINPSGAADTADDGTDQDCNGFDTVTCYTDGDSDTYGTGASFADANGCLGANQSTVDTDCNDADAGINPGAAEVADDGTDQDCTASTP